MRTVQRGFAAAFGLALAAALGLGGQAVAQDAGKRDDSRKAQELKVTKAAKSDEKAIAAQKLCPVSEEELGSMGTPVKVARGDDSVFLCCPACVKKVKADPEEYLNAIKVAKATEADAKAIARQKNCPVSGEDLRSMGMPVKVTRGEDSVFLCCEGCVKAVKADPEKYFGRADSPSKEDDSQANPRR